MEKRKYLFNEDDMRAKGIPEKDWPLNDGFIAWCIDVNKDGTRSKKDKKINEKIIYNIHDEGIFISRINIYKKLNEPKKSMSSVAAALKRLIEKWQLVCIKYGKAKFQTLYGFPEWLDDDGCAKEEKVTTELFNKIL